VAEAIASERQGRYRFQREHWAFVCRKRRQRRRAGRYTKKSWHSQNVDLRPSVTPL